MSIVSFHKQAKHGDSAEALILTFNLFFTLRPRSDSVTHVVSENSQASVLWAWLKDSGPANLPSMHVVNITWFTDSMKERRPVAVETRHLIQVGVFH